VQIGIEQPVEKIVDSWTINQGMAASYIGTSNQIESAVTGVVAIKSIGSDSSVLGSAQLTFPNHGVIRGGFTARWITAPVLCG